MTGDCHVRFCESGRGRFPPATHLKGGRWRSETDQAEMGEKAEAQHPTPGTDDQPAAYLTVSGDRR